MREVTCRHVLMHICTQKYFEAVFAFAPFNTPIICGGNKMVKPSLGHVSSRTLLLDLQVSSVSYDDITLGQQFPSAVRV